MVGVRWYGGGASCCSAACFPAQANNTHVTRCRKKSSMDIYDSHEVRYRLVQGDTSPKCLPRGHVTTCSFDSCDEQRIIPCEKITAVYER